MKKIMFSLLIICFILLTIFKVQANNTFPLLGKVIVVDPGHGGLDGGANVTNIYEKDINLSISKYLKEELEFYGASVIMTRDGDYDLSKPNANYRKKSDFDNRIILINNSLANMYLSIHLNIYQNSKYKGPQVFYYSKLNVNKNIAEIIQKELNSFTNNSRKIKPVTGIYMYEKLNIPGALIECGFLSNYFERNNLVNQTYQKDIAKKITKAIINYFNA